MTDHAWDVLGGVAMLLFLVFLICFVPWWLGRRDK